MILGKKKTFIRPSGEANVLKLGWKMKASQKSGDSVLIITGDCEER